MSRCVICGSEPVDGVPFAGIQAVSGVVIAPGLAHEWCAAAPEVLQRWLVQAEELDDDLGPVPADEMAEWLRAGGELSELGALHVLEELCQTRQRAEKAEGHAKSVVDGWREAHRLAYLTGANAQKEAAKVRRGARCLRERCRRLEARARSAEERADIARTAALYAWRMATVYGGPDVWMRNVLKHNHREVAHCYGAAFAAAGEAAWRAVVPEVGGIWHKEEP